MIEMLKANKAVLSLFQKKELTENVKEFLENFTDEEYCPLNIDVPLKHSMYNIVKHKGRTYIIYNTLFNSMITLSDAEYVQYENIRFEDLSLVEYFTDNGFIIPECVDEYHHYYAYKNILNNQYSSESHYTIVLTSKCNARCFYCYEEGVMQYDMSVETADRIAELFYASDKPINITWFGGEPLLKADIIDRITGILREKDREFTSDIITNGSLITEEMINVKFREWNIQWVQITLDGTKEEYMRRKCYYSNDADIYEKVLLNIDMMSKNDIPVSIRLNIDGDNALNCVSLSEYLKARYSDNKNISVYPAFLTDCGSHFNDESERLRYAGLIYDKYKPERSILSSIPKLNSCYYQQKCSFVIDADGSILCCERDVGRQKTKLATVYSIESLDTLYKPEKIFPETKKICQKCVYYPKCLGGCIATHSCKYEYDACFMERYKLEYLLDKIIDF